MSTSVGTPIIVRSAAAAVSRLSRACPHSV